MPTRLERVECARCNGALYVTEYTAALGGELLHPECLAEANREERC